jgi:hypothetical protein
MTPAERSLASRIGAYRQQATHDMRQTSKPGRDAAWQRFVVEVDPDRTLPEPERLRRAEAARRAHMARIALKSVQARARHKADAA